MTLVSAIAVSLVEVKRKSSVILFIKIKIGVLVLLFIIIQFLALVS